ncbi:MAG: hypothetical protein ABIW84_06300 [Ilumatobacteraceae bacterium]
MAHVTRTDLGGNVPSDSAPEISSGRAEVLISLVHLSDMHVLDAVSPARAEWIELAAADPVWGPLLHTHRPYEALTAFALHAHICTIRNRPIGRATGRAFDLAISTGDNIDNAQRNELDAYLALMRGGVAQMTARGSAQDAPKDHDDRWPYWSPDAEVEDDWRRRGYPVVEDFIERASGPIRSDGLDMCWTSIPGNHDLMRQGTALPTPLMDERAVGAEKSLRRPAGFAPADPLSHFVDHPETFSNGATFRIAADPDRRAIDREEWIAAHVAAGALGYADDAARMSIDRVIDTDHVRFVLLDTNHPFGDYHGSIGTEQLSWLDERLAEVDIEPNRIAIIVSHHGADTLVNDRGGHEERRLAGDMTTLVHRHPCAIAWLVGHRHINRIEARAGAAGGFWEITTSSTIDWPSQTRSLEVIRHGDGTLELICTMIDHEDAPDGMATLHRDLARRFATDGIAAKLAGRDLDRDVRLVLPPRRP